MNAVLADLETAPIADPLKATLRFLRIVTRGTPTADDVRAVYAAGVTKVQVREALAVAFCFNVITRLADTFKFEIPPAASFAASANMLLSRGYRM